MTKETAPKSPFADIAPALADYTDTVLFGDVWKRPGLSQRDRSLVTIVSLISLYRTNELPFHLKKALENGVTRDEIAEVITSGLEVSAIGFGCMGLNFSYGTALEQGRMRSS
jgi:4-carboxymuconolactone decarboxylase